MCSQGGQRHCEPSHLQVLRWKQHQLFIHHFKASSGSTHTSVFNLGPSDEEPKEGDPISKYCYRTKVLGTFCWDLQVLWPIPPFIQGRGRGSFSFLLLLLWRKAGQLLHIVFRNLFLKASAETAITGPSPRALLQRKSCSSRTFPRWSVVLDYSCMPCVPLHVSQLPLGLSCRCHQSPLAAAKLFLLGLWHQKLYA